HSLKTFEVDSLLDELLGGSFDVFNSPSETGKRQRRKRLNFLNSQRCICGPDHQREWTIFLKTQTENVTIESTRLFRLRGRHERHDITVREYLHALKIT